MKILILGSSGLFGRELYKNLYKNKKFKLIHNGLKKRKFDISKKKKFFKLFNCHPDVVINLVANTNIENCEINKKKTKLLNQFILKHIFSIQKKIKFDLIHFSTDQVYNLNRYNSEKAKICYLNYYTKTKIGAEKICENKDALVLRTNFFGKTIGGKSFSDWIVKSFKSKKQFYLFNDVWFSPLNINTICEIIEKIILNKDKVKLKGLYNLGSKGKILKSTFAIKIAKSLNIYNKNYKLIETNKILKVKRPNFMTMSSRKFERRFNIKLPSIDLEIERVSKSYKS